MEQRVGEYGLGFWCCRAEAGFAVVVDGNQVIDGLGNSKCECPCPFFDDPTDGELIEIRMRHVGFGILAVGMSCTCGHKVNRVERLATI